MSSNSTMAQPCNTTTWYLWWPPHKISSRYLASLLHYGEVHAEPEPPGSSLDVEVALPNEWHTEPMALDVNEPPRVD